MRSNPVNENIPALAIDEALALAEESERLLSALNALHQSPDHDRAAIGRTHQRLGVTLKLADVHASLAIAEQIRGLRADLTRDPFTDSSPAGDLLLTFADRPE